MGQKTHSTRKKHAWCWEPSQLPMTSEVLDLGGKLRTTSFLNQTNPNYILKTCSSTEQISVFLVPHQGNLSWKQTGPITENYNQTNAVVEHSLNWYIYNITHSPRAQESLRNGGGREIVRVRKSGSLLWIVSLRNVREFIPMKSHKYGWLMTWAAATLINMLTWIGGGGVQETSTLVS